MTGLRSWWLMRGLVIAGLCAALAFAHSVPLLWPQSGATDLADLIISARLFYPVWALVAAWLACWVTAQHTPESVLVGAAPGRGRGRILGRELGTTMIAVVAGVAVGYLPVLIAGITRFPWHLADLVAFVALLTGIASLVAVGACGAIVAGPRVGVVLAPVVTVATVVVPAFLINDILLLNRSKSVLSAAYMWSVGGPNPGERLVLATQLIQILFFTLVGFTALKVAVGLAEVRAARNPRGWTALAWVTLPVALMAFLAVQQPLLTEQDPDTRLHCESNDVLELCLYPKNEAERGFITDLLTPLMLPSADAQAPRTISQGGTHGVAVEQLEQVGGPRESWGAIQARMWAYRSLMTPTAECQAGALEEETSVVEGVTLARLRFAADKVDSPEIRAIYQQVLDESGHGVDVSGRFSSFDDAAWAAWVEQHREELDGCVVTAEDLP